MVNCLHIVHLCGVENLFVDAGSFLLDGDEEHIDVRLSGLSNSKKPDMNFKVEGMA